MLNYQTHIDNGSMFNTPPVVPIYAALLNLRWIKAQGGVKEMERRAIEKADSSALTGCNGTLYLLHHSSR